MILDPEVSQMLSETFSDCSLDVEQDESVRIPAPGDEFKHMIWSSFCTVPTYSIEFRVGSRKSIDVDGIVTLEHINKAINGLQIGQNDEIMRPNHNTGVVFQVLAFTRRQLGSNVPYFRYAMAYQP